MTIKSLLKKKSNWLQGCLAKDKHGAPISITSGRAVSWCLLGAAMQAYGIDERSSIAKLGIVIGKRFPRRVGMSTPESIIVDFNNHEKTTFADIRKIITEAKV